MMRETFLFSNKVHVANGEIQGVNLGNLKRAKQEDNGW